MKKFLKRFVSVAIVLLATSFFTVEATAGIKMWGREALIGGTSSVDNIPYADLADGYLCITVTSAHLFYLHRFEDSSAAAEASPDVIKPDDAGESNGRWLLVPGLRVQSDCSTILSGTCLDSDDGKLYSWDSDSVELVGVADWFPLTGGGAFDAGVGGFTVDADGDVTGKSFTSTKETNVAGLNCVYEKNGDEIKRICIQGPDNIAADLLRKEPNATPIDGQVRAHGTPDAGVSTITYICSSPVIKIADDNYTVGTTNPCELYGGIIYVTVTGKVITFPAVSGLSISPVIPSTSVITVGDITVSVNVNGDDVQYLNADPAAGVISADNLSTAGDMNVLTYYNADGWVSINNGWTDGD